MHPILMIPGYGNSGPGHWQTLWQELFHDVKRVEMPSWNAPRRAGWVEALDTAIHLAQEEGAPVLVAHSLGCLAVAHWAALHIRPIHGALLVAPTDPEREDAMEALKDFSPVPLHTLPFPTRVVASSDDPYVSLERAKAFADAWGAAFTDLGPRGHINSASGHGEWPRGQQLLRELRY